MEPALLATHRWTAPPDTGQPRQPACPAPGERRIPLRGARRAAAEKFARSRREIPEATVWVDVDATDAGRDAAHAERARPAAAGQLLALLARFVVPGCASTRN